LSAEGIKVIKTPMSTVHWKLANVMNMRLSYEAQEGAIADVACSVVQLL
jgi:hypothetical protein